MVAGLIAAMLHFPIDDRTVGTPAIRAEPAGA
jgi:hypothetical protein